MAIINLRDFYPYYTHNEFVEVPDDVAEALLEAERQEDAYQHRVSYHRAYYSLDAGDGIEREALPTPLTPCEICERAHTLQQLCAALNALPDKQARRVYAHYILGRSVTRIARAEGVGKVRVSNSIRRGLRNMKIFMEKLD